MAGVTYLSSLDVEVNDTHVTILGRTYPLRDIRSAKVAFRNPALVWFGLGFFTASWLVNVVIVSLQFGLGVDAVSLAVGSVLQHLVLLLQIFLIAGLLLFVLGQRNNGVSVRLEGTFGYEDTYRSRNTYRVWGVVRAINRALKAAKNMEASRTQPV